MKPKASSKKDLNVLKDFKALRLKNTNVLCGGKQKHSLETAIILFNLHHLTKGVVDELQISERRPQSGCDARLAVAGGGRRMG
jgi:hypothetical protein